MAASASSGAPRLFATATVSAPASRADSRGVVLGPFERAGHGGIATGEEIDQPLVRPAESRIELDAVLDREPTGRTGARIDQPAGSLQQASGGFPDGKAQSWHRIADRDEGCLLVVEHRRQRLLGRPAIGVAVAGKPALGVHAPSDCCSQKIPLRYHLATETCVTIV
jgi:hypothetical protein